MSLRTACRRSPLLPGISFLLFGVAIALPAAGGTPEGTGMRWNEEPGRHTRAPIRAAEPATLAPAALPVRAARVVLVQGLVQAIEKDLFGRTERVAILSISDEGILVLNAVEDVSAGQKLKEHVGDAVTARSLILVKVDGRASLLVESFDVHARSDGGGED
jgi:hypothetical protein